MKRSTMYLVQVLVNDKWEPHFHASSRAEADEERRDQTESGYRARVIIDTTSQKDA